MKLRWNYSPPEAWKFVFGQPDIGLILIVHIPALEALLHIGHLSGCLNITLFIKMLNDLFKARSRVATMVSTSWRMWRQHLRFMWQCEEALTLSISRRLTYCLMN